MLQLINFGVIKNTLGAMPGVYMGASGSSIKLTFCNNEFQDINENISTYIKKIIMYSSIFLVF